MSANADTPAKTGTNAWDAAIALIIVGGLVVLAVYLVRKYGDDVEKIAAVLGVAAPVLAAGFGVTLGYFGGKQVGEATGEKKGKQELAAKVEAEFESLQGEGVRAQDAQSQAALERVRAVVRGAS